MIRNTILKEINPEYSVEGLMLKLKLQYFGYLIRRANSLEKTQMLVKIVGRMRWLDGIINSMDMSLNCCSVTQSCLILCNPMDYSMPAFPVLHYLPEFA